MAIQKIRGDFRENWKDKRGALSSMLGFKAALHTHLKPGKPEPARVDTAYLYPILGISNSVGFLF